LSGGTLTSDLNIGNGGSNTGLAIYHGAGAGDYGRIRFYQGGSNQSTIHVFPPAWQGASFAGGSAGSINLTGQNGVTFGDWDVPGMAVNKAGETWVRGNINLGYDPAYAIGRNFWAGGGGYTGYQFTGGNNRFGFSSTSGYIDVYTDGNFYAGIDFNGSNNLVLHAGNYNSYSPTLTGGNASGSWGISILGTARALDSSHSINRSGTSGNLNTDFGNTPAGTMRHAGDDANVSNSPGGSWWFYDHYRHSNGSNLWGTQVAWGWEDNSLRLAQRNVSGGGYSGWTYYLNSNNYTSYTMNRGGDTITGIIYFQTNRNGRSGNTDSAALQAYSTGNNSAFMSFHKGGHYATNMGLDDDNVMRIGGWSAAANRWQLDMSGNGTYAGNVTAYSDERLKKDWAAIPSDFVERLAQIKSGTYTRIDSEERQAGVSAQDFQKLLPETVSEDNQGTLSLAYGNAALVSAVELAKEVTDLRARVAQLENLISKLILKD
jgi:hypothetical protein